MARKVYDEEKIRAIAEKIRECAGTKETFTTEEMPSGVDKVYNAGVEAGKSQGGGKPTLYGTYVLKEPINREEDLIDRTIEETFTDKGVYAYFYADETKDYRYLAVNWLHIDGWFYDWAVDVGDVSIFKTIDEFGKWGNSVTNIYTGDTIYAEYPDIKGRIIVFTEPTEVSEDFYNLFTATIDTEIDIFGEGEESGVAEGIEQGIVEGIEQGKKAEYDRFWDSIQVYGTRVRYERTFEYTQWDKPLNPKYSLGNANMTANIFANTKVGDNLYTDKLDFAKSASLNSAFYSSDATRLKRIDARSASSGYNGMSTIFSWCQQLKEITEFYPSVNTRFSGAFDRCGELETLNVCSEIAVEGFNVQWSTKLSKSSLISIINALRDNSGTDTWNTITLGAQNLAKLTDEELAIMTNKQWQYS